MPTPPCEPGNWQARICALEEMVRTILANEGHPPMVVTEGEEFAFNEENQTLTIPEPESSTTLLPGVVRFDDAADRGTTAPQSLQQIGIQTTDPTYGNNSLWVATGLTAGDWAHKVGTLAAQVSTGVNITGGSISGITDLAIADGGTGASTVAAARTNLTLPTATPVGGVLDWAVSDKYAISLAANQTFTFTNLLDGKDLELIVTDTAGVVLTFPTVKWPANTQPTPSGTGKTDRYFFSRRGPVTYGRSELNYTT